MKNFIKTTTIIFSLIVIVFSLCSCGNDTNNDEQVSINNEASINNEPSTYENAYDIQTTDNSANSNKIDISEIADVQFLNFNGYGFVQVDNDTFALEYVISQETIKNFVSSVAPQLAFEIYGKGYDCHFGEIINYEPESNYNRLRNGDVVNVIAKVTDEFAAYGVTIDAVKQGLGVDFHEVVQYTVSGLLEGFNPIDVMSGIEQYVVFEGTSGNISARVEFPENYVLDIGGFHIEAITPNSMRINNSEGTYFYFSYEINDDSLKTGDTVLVELKSTGRNSDVDLITLMASSGGFFTDLYKEIVVPVM